MALERRLGGARVAPLGDTVPGRPRGVLLARLVGIEIRLDPSVLLMFGLILVTLGQSVFVAWQPDWSSAQHWTTAWFAACGLLVSLLAHELAHALVARSFGIRVPRITLFLFGGVAEMESDARTPGAECAIALAGPLLSFALAFLFAGIGQRELSAEEQTLLLSDPAQALASSGAVTTVCLWLASINGVLALFNLVPGFPLDGGRVLRALVWRFSGNLVLATRVAAAAGQYVGWSLMLIGAWMLLGQGRGAGLWYLFLGWFLSHLARASLSDVILRQTLRLRTARDLMETRFDTVDAELGLDVFVEQYLLRGAQMLWPVREQGRVVGMAGVADASRFPPVERARRRVSDVMEPLESLPSIHADAPVSETLPFLTAAGDLPVPVLDHGVFVGLLRGRDVLRWIALHPLVDGVGSVDAAGSARSIRNPINP
ncbi:MAG: site-2 protease family protein [Pseudomonadales bacterium]